MELIREYALLFVVAAPILVLLVMNVWLAWNGERGTLLLPGLHRFPSVEIAQVEAAVPVAQAVAANDEAVREAA